MDIEQLKQKYNYDAATAVMKQYLDIKLANIECLVLFRMGDFYELFYEDAVIAARILGIALTKRGKANDEEIAMCGVPHHALENYVPKLLEEDFKVAICDQLETPEEAKKRGGYKAVVTRQVTRIITPGTIIEEALIASDQPNYLVSIALDSTKLAHLAIVDLSVSSIAVTSVSAEKLIDELLKLAPREILLAEKFRSTPIAKAIEENLNLRISFQVNNFYQAARNNKSLLDYYKISSIEAIGQLSPGQVIALGSILEYILLTQKASSPRLPKPKILHLEQYMAIDGATRKNLGITTGADGAVKGSLFACLNHTMTKAGARLLYKYLANPLTNEQRIKNRQVLTNFFYQNISFTNNLRQIYRNVGDLERCITRLSMGRSTPKDLLSIANIILIASEIREQFINKNLSIPAELEKILQHLVGLDEIKQLIEEAINPEAGNNINEGNIIRPQYHPKVEELQNILHNARAMILALRDQYRAKTGIDSLKISNNNVLGLFIEITARNAGKIKDELFIHRQTTINSVRYTTTQLQELETKIVNANQLVGALELEIYQQLVEKIIGLQAKLFNLANSLAMLDVFANFAYIADEYDYCQPEITSQLEFHIEHGRHPVIEQILAKTNQSFVQNNCNLADKRLWLITGPNMAGKSTFLRQNALITIMAQIGSFVPASKAKIGIVDKIFSRIGAGDNLGKGLSTFMLEMLETSAILAQATPKSLIILDEIGRGTSTYDGVAIAWSVLEYIHDKLKSRCLFATHYHELVELEKTLPALANYTVAINDQTDNIVFLYQIIAGYASKSYGVHVAKLAGLPPSVIKKALQLLEKLEQQQAKNSPQLVQQTSHNMDLFVHHARAEPTKAEQLMTKIEAINPDQLTPKAALELLYELKMAIN